MAQAVPSDPVLPRRLPVLAAAASTSRPPPASVRVSITDRCDLACVYCRPSRNDGYLDERLDEASWQSMIRGLVSAGVRRVRITGGEPLVHPRVVERVRFVASLGVEDLALTTNGTRLAALAPDLRRAGLQRLTVSLDSLRPERFARITRGGDLDRVLDGIEAARHVGFAEIKTNTVVLRGENDDEIGAITDWAWTRGIVPRFIEVMRVGEGAKLSAATLFSAAEMRRALGSRLGPGSADAEPNRGPARYVRARHDPSLRVGFISGTSDTYCEGCDRLRVASDGVLRPCLATNDGVSVSALARDGDVTGVAAAVDTAWALKPDGRTWKGCTESTASDVSMRAIGG